MLDRPKARELLRPRAHTRNPGDFIRQRCRADSGSQTRYAATSCVEELSEDIGKLNGELHFAREVFSFTEMEIGPAAGTKLHLKSMRIAQAKASKLGMLPVDERARRRGGAMHDGEAYGLQGSVS